MRYFLRTGRLHPEVTGAPPVDSGPWTIGRLNRELRGGFSRLPGIGLRAGATVPVTDLEQYRIAADFDSEVPAGSDGWVRNASTAFWPGGSWVGYKVNSEAVAFAGCGADESTVTCGQCGHVVTLRRGDDPIPFGDPRLCEHMGGA
jgi:hypothetical protein